MLDSGCWPTGQLVNWLLARIEKDLSQRRGGAAQSRAEQSRVRENIRVQTFTPVFRRAAAPLRESFFLQDFPGLCLGHTAAARLWWDLSFEAPYLFEVPSTQAPSIPSLASTRLTSGRLASRSGRPARSFLLP
jgi:hypothetical protein